MRWRLLPPGALSHWTMPIYRSIIANRSRPFLCAVRSASLQDDELVLQLYSISFVLQQPALALDPSAVAGQGSVRADNTMTWQHNWNGIEGVRSTDGTVRGRLAKFRRNFTIVDRRSRWNGA